MKFFQKIIVFLIVTVFLLNGLNVYADYKPLYAQLVSVEHMGSEEYEGKYEVVCISFDAKRDFSSFTLKSPDRIVIDVKYALFDGKFQTISGGEIAKNIRYSQYEKNTVRIVIDTNGEQDYKIEQVEGLLKIYIGGNVDNINDSQINIDAEKNTDREQNNRGGLISRGDNSIKDELMLGFITKDKIDQVSIFLDNYRGYVVSRLSNPNRIIIDIPNTKAPNAEQEIKVDGSQVKNIRYAQYSGNMARIVIDTTQFCSYKIEEKSGKLDMFIEAPVLPLLKNFVFKNLVYNTSIDRVSLRILGSALTQGGGEGFKKLYTEKYSSDGLTYTLSFRSNLVDIPEGVMQINDNYLESITVNRTIFSINTSIIFRAKDKFIFDVMARPLTKDTAITILKPALNNERIVVIDAGHGGAEEPGAVHGGLKEKDINLDIALRLNDLLKSKNIKTYMIRDDDSYVWYYERASIANKLNASLFLSIHNNAMDDKSFDGAMSLYSINKNEKGTFNSLSFAKIVQNGFVNSLGMKDRKVRERNDLVVTRLTNMPAVLAEVAFMTNSSDRAKLQSADFKQKAAQTLCDSIEKALSQIK